MGIWKSVFLHEFPDGDPNNLHAIPGELELFPSGHPVVGPPPEPENRGFDVRRGQGLTYHFKEPLTDVIGVDLSVDMLGPFQFTSPNTDGEVDSIVLPVDFTAFPVVSLGDGRVKFSMRQVTFAFIGPELMAIATIRLEVDGQRMEVRKNLRLPPQRTNHLRIRWHTHGQAQIWLEGTLRAYEPGFAAGRSFGLDRLVIGGPAGVVVEHGVAFRARRVYLKVLRQDDARKEIDRHIPIDDRYLKPTACAERVRVLNEELISRGRGFMTGIVSSLTTTWREGQPDGPFSPQAIAAHSAAVEAAQAFGNFLDTREPASADTFLRRIGEFLDILAAADPAGFAELLADLMALAETLDPSCRQELKPLFDTNAELLEPIAQLLEAVWERAQNALPGGPHA